MSVCELYWEGSKAACDSMLVMIDHSMHWARQLDNERC